MLRGLRGATTVTENKEELILTETYKLVNVMIEKNDLKPEEISHVFISVTNDLNATFPAKVLRQIEGWLHVPVMCMKEIDVPNSLQKCVRIMMVFKTNKKQAEVEHIYLNEATRLRPDLVKGKNEKRSLKAKRSLQHLNSYQQGMQIEDVRKKFDLKEIVKLSSNENPYGSSPKVSKFLKKQDIDLAQYPDGYTTKLRHVLKQKYKIHQDQIVFGAGSDELVQIISRTFLTSNDHVVMATPTFPQYKHHCTIEGASYTEVPHQKNGAHDLSAMLKAINDNTKIVWICNPNNPTGTAICKKELKRFLEEVPKHILVVLDEAYYEYVNENEKTDSIQLIDEYCNVIVLRTFSKAYGLASLRIGYGISNLSIIEKLNIVRGPFNTSVLAQEAAIVALEDESYLKKIVRENKRVRERFMKFLNKINWPYYKSDANFILVETPEDDKIVFEYLLKNGFIVRPGSKLGIPNTIRITIGKAKDMARLENILKNFTKHQVDL